MKTEQEFWDEFEQLLDAQEGESGSRHIKLFNPLRSSVFRFMKEMNEAGFEKEGTVQPNFTNRFFSCLGRTISICSFANGRMELRWG
jgi:hypothetical protein